MSDARCSAVVVAITGGIACGKSEVGRILGEMGFRICDADLLAHQLMARGTPIYHKIVDRFGKKVLAENDEISRPALGQIVFNDSDQRMRLNELIHPAVRDGVEQWIAQRRGEEVHAAVQIPLLFESGMETLDWDAILCVSSSESQTLERLEKRGIGREEALQRIRAQMALAEKERLADRVIQNLGTIDELEDATREVVEDLLVER